MLFSTFNYRWDNFFTGEYHYKDVTKESAVSESFFCDVEIALFSEPIVVAREYESQYESPVGSNTLSLLGEKVKSIQTQSFCRVLKSRRTPNQARRCAYDIVTGKGVSFYETYPGDGHLVLFYENAQEHEIWRTLFHRDAPTLYPALRCDSFDRSSLQRISAAQRRFRYVPQRTDMYLSSFDNYWLNWYSEMCLKANIADILKRELQIDDFRAPEMAALLNEIHAGISKIKGQVKFHEDLWNVLKGRFMSLPRSAFDGFFSGLLDQLRLNAQAAGAAGKGREANRPCLRCLWTRRLLSEMLSLLCENKEGQGPTKDDFVRLCRAARDDPVSETKEIYGFKSETARLVQDALRICQESQEDSNCAHGPPGSHFANPGSLRRFLQGKHRPACLWKTTIRAYVGRLFWWVKDPRERSKVANAIAMGLGNHIFGEILPRRIINQLNIINGCLLPRQGLNREEWVVKLGRVFLESVQPAARYRLVTPVLCDKLRLFGERRSEVIAEMECHQPDAKRPVHRPWHLFSLRDQNKYSSIPYNANIGFIVYRREIVSDFYGDLQKDNGYREKYVKRIQKLIDEQNGCLLKACKGVKTVEVPRKRIEALVNQSCGQGHPQTWEEIIAFFLEPHPALVQRYRRGDAEEDKSAHRRLIIPPGVLISGTDGGETEAISRKSHFLIETRTPDTYLCTMLEFIWSCGADLRIFPDYTIQSCEKTLPELMRAFYLLRLMFQHGIIPTNSTLEVNEFSRVYGDVDGRWREGQADWVFARHWYSTLVDILSAPKKGKSHPVTTEEDYQWQQKGAKLDIMPIPVSISNYLEHGGQDVPHVSCWGDWHFGVLSGTENEELSIHLINELMSSDRICERAFANAAIPTVEAFYDHYGDNPCLHFPVRRDITLPHEWTYKRLRDELFKHAKSRSQIFDYHHCIRELHSVMEYVRTLPQGTDAPLDSEKLMGKLNGALDKIRGFKDKPFLLEEEH